MEWKDKQTNQQTLFQTPSDSIRWLPRGHHATVFSHDRLGPNKSYQPIKIVNREIRNTFQHGCRFKTFCSSSCFALL